MKTRAAVLTAPNRHFEVVTLDLQPPRDGEVLVQIKACGVCHSDWHVATGDTQQPMPCVTGHEGAGVIVETGPNVRDLRPGQHVMLSWAPDCGECFYCLRGQPNLCTTYTDPLWEGVMLDGTPRLSWDGAPVYHYCGLAAFSEYAVVPVPACIPLPDDMPLAPAALVGCAVATGIGATFYTAQVRPGQSVVIYGAGGVGLNAIQGAALCGAYPIIAVDLGGEKDAIARTMGATHFVQGCAGAVEAIHALTGGRGADHVIETVGAVAVQEQALGAVRPGGVLTLVGLSSMGSGTNLPGALIVRKEFTIKGSYYGSVSPRRDFPRFVELYQAGRLKLDELIARTYPLDAINTAFADMLSGAPGRGVVVF